MKLIKVLFVFLFLSACPFMVYSQFEVMDLDSLLNEEAIEIDTIDIDDIPVVKTKSESDTRTIQESEFETINIDTIAKDTVVKAPPKPLLMVDRLALVSQDYSRELNINFNEIISFIKKKEFVPLSELDEKNPSMFNELALRKYLLERNIEVTDTTVNLLILLKEWYDYDNYWDESWGYDDKPVVNRIFLPIIFKGENLLPKNYKMYRAVETEPTELPLPLKLDYDLTQLNKSIRRDSIENIALFSVYTEQPWLVRYSSKILPAEILREEVIEAKKIPKLFEPENLVNTDYGKVDKFAPKVKNWIPNFSSSVQFAQNYFSDNWFQGGESNLTLASVQTFTANYSNRKNITWTNLAEWRLAFISVPSDTMRAFKISDDQLRLYSMFGLKAFGKFNYSLSGELKTKFFNAYVPNTKNITSGFFSPLTGNLNLGLTYNYASPKGKLTLSLTLAPAALNWTYVMDKELASPNPKDPEARSYTSVGSSITGNMTWSITKYVVWKSRLYMYTSYQATKIEFENTIDMILNRFLSTKLYLFPLYDDTKAPKIPGGSYIQIKEMLSFGFNFKI